ncbi:hypothetical protein BBJ28_00005273 [Nothophytophthora sp. Chile5]|nr:hypothetical protein BBJ28_00005273 [Nothophytophthora sp. Chile5]
MERAACVQDVVPFEGRFPSWEAFDVARSAHCEKTHTMYVCRNTVKVAVANRRRKLQVPDDWVYDRKVYVCTHGYKRVSRSSGSRPRQRVRFTNCKARFTACVASELGADGCEALCIKITGQCVAHEDHPVGLDQWRMYSQNRVGVIEHPYLTHEAELLRRMGSNKRAARIHIETLSGKVCTMKDMHNLYARLQKREAAVRTTRATGSGGSPHRSLGPIGDTSDVRVESVLQRFVDAHVENHVSLLSGDDGSNEAICLASRAMKEHFQVFPELLLLDITPPASSTALRRPATPQLHGLLSMDALGNAKPVFLAQSLAISPSLLRRICQDFKRTHPKWVHTKVLVMTKLLPEVVQVLKREFPQARLLLCQFHVLKLLSGLLVQTQAQARTQVQQHGDVITSSILLGEEQTREQLQRLVFARSESRYNEAKALLAQQLSTDSGRELLTLLERNWEPYRSLWASYARAEVFEFSVFFAKGMESFWNPLKGTFQRAGPPSSGIAAVAAGESTASRLTRAVSSVSSLPPSAVEVFTASGNAAGTRATALPVVVPSASAFPLERPDASDNHSSTSATRDSSGSLAKCISEVLTMLQFMEDEWTSKMLILELTKPVASDRCDPLLHFMLNCLSSFAVGLVSSQLTTQSARASGSVSITKSRAPKAPHSSEPVRSAEPQPATAPAAGATMCWLDKTTREKRVLQRDCSGCDCDFFALYRLPCRHLIWYEVSVLQHKRLSLAAVGPRWFLRSFQPPKLASQRESNEIEYHIL